ncbi:DNA repair protein REV1 isoform X2 [Nematostella vectensis]|uniref:DNA repair protein REV1 isoform X2 n=1 Tax=Nematostella vectensis TaxID=45351 RepID=UPI002077238B|nr:DNA repair protein REV1 isoform X2 [Nematostella vectensis]
MEAHTKVGSAFDMLKGDQEDVVPKRKQNWGDWGGYMKAKNQKLEQQFREDTKEVVADRGQTSLLFQGVSIHVNGYTVPPADELRRLIGQYGGRYVHYYSRSTVTHIIATNLPDSKIRELKDKKVVQPNWILDSIKQGRLLPINNYLLCSGRKPSQAALRFSTTDTTTTNTATSKNPGFSRKESLHGNAISDTATTREEVLSKVLNTHEGTVTTAGKSDLDVMYSPGRTGSPGKNSSAFDKSPGMSKVHVSISETSPRKQRRAGDPNFVSDFYHNSRLHYLSTWGAEFKQFTANLIKDRVSKGIGPNKRSGPGVYGRVIMHIDMDCFFVSVYVRDHPELDGKPVAVCHAGKSGDQVTTSKVTSPDKSSAFFNSMSEIASCSYAARECGVRNGMFLGQARKLCPDITCVPYLFDKYRQVSQRLYEILVSYSHDIEAVSCDEAFLDVTHSLDAGTEPMALAQQIRAEIRAATRCNASAGISSNVLLARMCTRIAKPDGQFYLSREDDVIQFMASQKAKDLPGVGWALSKKLNDMGVETCADLQKLSLQALQKEFGPKTGLSLHRSCRGVDDRPLRVERERKSVSAEINYGIRFTQDYEGVKFIEELAGEVHKRLREVGLKGRCITLKLKVRQEGAPMPRKFMGHGICDNVSRSATLVEPTDDNSVIARECLNLLKTLNIPAHDFRGLGIQVSKLTNSSAGSKTLFDFMRCEDSTAEKQEKDEIRTASDKEDKQPYVNAVGENIQGTIENSDLQTDLENRKNIDQLRNAKNHSSQDIATSHSAGRGIPDIDFAHLSDTQCIDNSLCNSIAGDVSNRQSRDEEKAPLSPDMDKMQCFSPPDSLPPLPKFTPSPSGYPCRTGVNQGVESSGNVSGPLYLPSPSQIDPSVLEALPADIRAGIERHYAERNGGQPGNSQTRSRPSLDITKSSPEPGVGRRLVIRELPSPSQLDPECLAALPKKLQDELQQAYRRRPIAKRIHYEGIPTCSRSDPVTVEEVQPFELGNSTEQVIEDNTIPSPSRVVSLGGAITLAEVKATIREWTLTPVPLDEDVDEVSNYLLRLIDARNLELLWNVIKYMLRCVQPRGMEDWREACQGIIDKVQTSIVGQYGSRLPIEKVALLM